MADGNLTGRVGARLKSRLAEHRLKVYYDHPQGVQTSWDDIGRIVAWYGPEQKRGSQLTFLDIAIVHQDGKHVLALIEIEETTTKPKVLLGDALATLLGDQITFKGTPLLVGPDTIFLILAQGKRRGQRMEFLEKQVNALRPYLKTPNSSVGQIIIDTFVNEVELEAKILHYIGPQIAANVGDVS